jgi:hypothetical protein
MKEVTIHMKEVPDPTYGVPTSIGVQLDGSPLTRMFASWESAWVYVSKFALARAEAGISHRQMSDRGAP